MPDGDILYPMQCPVMHAQVHSREMPRLLLMGKSQKLQTLDTGHWTLDTGHWTLGHWDTRPYGAERDAIMQPKTPKLEPQVL